MTAPKTNEEIAKELWRHFAHGKFGIGERIATATILGVINEAYARGVEDAAKILDQRESSVIFGSSEFRQIATQIRLIKPPLDTRGKT